MNLLTCILCARVCGGPVQLVCIAQGFEMSASRGTDAVRVLRGARIVLEEAIKVGEQNCKKNMKNCSVAAAAKDATIRFADRLGAAKLKVMYLEF